MQWELSTISLPKNLVHDEPEVPVLVVVLYWLGYLLVETPTGRGELVTSTKDQAREAAMTTGKERSE